MALYRFSHWEDGSTNPTREINLTSDDEITAYYEQVTPTPAADLHVAAAGGLLVVDAILVAVYLGRKFGILKW